MFVFLCIQPKLEQRRICTEMRTRTLKHDEHCMLLFYLARWWTDWATVMPVGSNIKELVRREKNVYSNAQRRGDNKVTSFRDQPFRAVVIDSIWCPIQEEAISNELWINIFLVLPIRPLQLTEATTKVLNYIIIYFDANEQYKWLQSLWT